MKIKELENFEDVEIYRIGFRCKKCSREWGLRTEEYSNFSEIPKEKFECLACKVKEEQKIQ